ncbi:MAG TPA: hypothetical protein VKQ30_24980 [Ktedonobacterales bacterium]|nr:hypothetical protein [Ktedonobacterales bacterium]
MAREHADAVDTGALIGGAIIICCTALLVVLRFVGFSIVRLVSRSFRRYGATPALRCWLAVSVTTIGFALLIALLSSSALAWLAVAILTPAAFIALSLLERILDALTQQPPADQELSLPTAWDKE